MRQEESPTLALLHMPGRLASHHEEGEHCFLSLLESFLGGGGNKTQRGEVDPWWCDAPTGLRATWAFLGTSISSPVNPLCCIPCVPSHMVQVHLLPPHIHTPHASVRAGVRGEERGKS